MNKLVLAICLAAACGGAQVKPLPAWYTTANTDNPAFPQRRYLTAVGLSSSSSEDADKRAMANVSAAISAQLQSETSSFQQYSSVTGNTKELVTNNVSVRSSFDRADLIRIVERQTQPGAFYSFAALDRAVADRELAGASNADLSSFNASADAARNADAMQNTGAFGIAAANAGKLRAKLDAAFIVRRAVAGRPADEEAAYVAQRNSVLAMLEQHRSRRVVGVVLKSAGNSHLNDFTVNAVKRMGLRPDPLSCDKRDKSQLTDATELSVEPVENCAEGSLGERCEVTVRLTALACAGGTTGAGTIAMVRGVNPSDRDKARRAAWEKVTPALVEAAVRDALKSAMSLGE
jgi:LPP20 lipoprotein